MGPQRFKQTSSASARDDVLSPISCEVCRQRKCKCDRRLPFCSQCSNEASKCIYPESGKRGLPLGYLNRLEQRLAETESALYGALLTLASTNTSTTVQATVKPGLLHKSKAARMDEWSQLPLRDWPDIYRWKTSVGDQFILNQSQGSMSADSSGVSYAVSGSPTADSQSHSCRRETEARGSAGLAWQPEQDVHMGSPYEINRQPTEIVPSPVYSTDQAPESAVTTLGRLRSLSNATTAGNSATGSQQADELSKSRPSIYF